MTITFSKVEFDGPIPLFKFAAPARGGIYAIMIKPYPQTKPDTYRVVYIGQSGDLEGRGFPTSHHKYPCWKQQAGSDANLYIGIHLTPGANETERTELEQRLIRELDPPCNG